MFFPWSKNVRTQTHTHGQKVFVFSLSVHHLNSQHCNSQFTETCASPGRKCSFFPSGKVFPLKLFIIRPKSFPSPQDSTDKPERVHTGKEENCVCLCFHTCVVTNKLSLCAFPDFVDFVQAEKYTCCFSQYIQKNSCLSLTHTHTQTHTHTHKRTHTRTRPPCRLAPEHMAPTPSLRPPQLRSHAVSQFAEDSVCSCGQEMPPFFPLSLPHPLLERAPLLQPRNTGR